MPPATKMFRLFALSTALGQAVASFSLNTGGPSWDYTTKDLADSTSQACKDAYSASINCDETLVKLVASLDPDFHPDSSDLGQTCTKTCKDSLDDYVKNVKAACDQDGDLAGLDAGRSLNFTVPVSTPGEVFQYVYGEACAKNGTDYCYLTFSKSHSWASKDFACSDNCAVKFMQNAHENPGSAYWFFYETLTTQSSYWEDVFAGGWKTVVKCGLGGSDASSVSSSASSSKTDSVLSSSTSLSNSQLTGSATSTPTSTAAVTSTTAPANSATATSGASRLRILFF